MANRGDARSNHVGGDGARIRGNAMADAALCLRMDSFSTYAGTTRKLGVGLLVIQIVCLRELLRANHRYIFTLIQKFQTSDLLCDRPDVIVLTDEAHRSQ